MSKIKINSVTDAEIKDLTTPKKPKTVKGVTLINKACILLSVWGIILSVISGGIMLCVISSVLLIASKSWKNLNTSSAKWALWLTVVSVIVNIVMTMFLNI